MTTKPMLTAVIVVAAAALFLAYRWKSQQPRTFKSTDDFIQWSASEAVRDADSQDHIQLDYSVDSLKTVDNILGRVHEAYVKNPVSVSVKGLGSAYGAYVGEVIRRSEPGSRWERDDAVGGEKSYPLIWRRLHLYPFGWCQKRILNGDEESIWTTYAAAKEQASHRIL